MRFGWRRQEVRKWRSVKLAETSEKLLNVATSELWSAVCPSLRFSYLLRAARKRVYLLILQDGDGGKAGLGEVVDASHRTLSSAIRGKALLQSHFRSVVNF